MNRYSLLIPVLLLLTGCDSLDLQTADADIPVVQAYLQPDSPIEVEIWRQLIFQSEDTTQMFLTDLGVFLSNGDDTYHLVHTDSGRYTHEDIVVSPGQQWTLSFTYRDKEVGANTLIPGKPENFQSSGSTIEVFSFGGGFGGGTPPSPPEPIDLTWDNPEGNYHMIVVENTEEDPELINEDTDRPPRNFRNAPTQSSSQELNPFTFNYYGRHRVILYQLNPEYAALYEQLGTSSLDIVAPPSNISEGLGIFTGIHTDTLFVEVVPQ
ncbi:DUF4249 family protein [Pontibacter sp. G13]|uniref:DUF4249 family protein n=1 Tax=Pontibacter sp. G13 TaxID=3074898 RepID=UPI00288904EA|nr:DUF4249 family protein [Pontibacter sp. G13]WNJ18425.1 DUF4249 family protein [Pontibacter sp. G13]